MRGVCLVLLALLLPSVAWGQEFTKGDGGTVGRSIEVEFANPAPRKNAFGAEFSGSTYQKKNKCFLRPGGTIEIRSANDPLLIRYRNDIKDVGDEFACPADDTLFFMDQSTFKKYWEVKGRKVM